MVFLLLGDANRIVRLLIHYFTTYIHKVIGTYFLKHVLRLHLHWVVEKKLGKEYGRMAAVQRCRLTITYVEVVELATRMSRQSQYRYR